MQLPVAEMNTILQILIVVGLAVAVLFFYYRLRARLRRLRRPPPARRGTAPAPVRRRWEMCVVSTDEQEPYVEYWDETGPDRKSLVVTDAVEPDASYVRVRRVLAQLGEAGWEMTGIDGPRIFFRRMKP